MFQRFAERSRRILVGAQEEARLLHHHHIGSEHLLVALARDADDETVDGALASFALTHVALRETVAEVVPPEATVPSGHIPFTPDAKNVLEGALREALRLDDDTIEPEHVLLAITAETSSAACRVLEARGVRPAALAAKVHELRVAESGATGSARAASRSAKTTGMLQTWRRPPMATGRVEPRCALCGRDQARTERVLLSGGFRLCAECARAAVAQLDVLPDDAPKLVRYQRTEVVLSDRDAAVTAIEQAFDAVLGPLHLPLDDALAFAEGGDGCRSLVETIREAREHAPFVMNDQTVERVRFLDADEAEVSVGIWLVGNPQPMILPAHAIREDGTWKVSRSTLQQIAQQAQMFRRPPPGP
jgi:hypothetical protein